ncbi:SAVED domain-containing protein [Acidovorax sp.]|uniref:SAVED domain-containing protein n=1 Tax=Acidovorax sp. TaxID=1872122 RepID=UPI00391F37E6
MSWIQQIVNRLLDWYTRPRSVGLALLKHGVVLAGVTLASDWALKLALQSDNENWSFSFGTGQGLPSWVTIPFSFLAFGLIVTGAGTLIWDSLRERRRRLVVIELRGLHSSPDTPAVSKVLPAFRGDRRHLLIDFRPQGQDARVDTDYMLEQMASLKPTLQSLTNGVDKRDVQVAVGGLAAVPALCLAGMLLDDESHVHLYDWDRSARNWRGLDGIDDSIRFQPLEGLDTASNLPEAVLVVEASYAINAADIAQTFGESVSVVRLRVSEPLADRFWSEQKQNAMAAQFRDAVQQLQAQGVRKIHLVAAAPASLSIRLGMGYDRRLHPELIVYQFERGLPKAYPWGLRMPTAGIAMSIVRN